MEMYLSLRVFGIRVSCNLSFDMGKGLSEIGKGLFALIKRKMHLGYDDAKPISKS